MQGGALRPVPAHYCLPSLSHAVLLRLRSPVCAAEGCVVCCIHHVGDPEQSKGGVLLMYAQRMHAGARVLGLLLVCLLSRADSRLLERLFWLGHISAEPRCVQAAKLVHDSRTQSMISDT